MDALRIGAAFPALAARATDGAEWRLPDALRGRPAVLLFYRGHW